MITNKPAYIRDCAPSDRVLYGDQFSVEQWHQAMYLACRPGFCRDELIEGQSIGGSPPPASGARLPPSASRRPPAAVLRLRLGAPLRLHPHVGIAREHGARDVAGRTHDHFVARTRLGELRDQCVPVVERGIVFGVARFAAAVPAGRYFIWRDRAQ